MDQSSKERRGWRVAVVMLIAVALPGCGASLNRRDAAPRLSAAKQLKIAERGMWRTNGEPSLNHGSVRGISCEPVGPGYSAYNGGIPTNYDQRVESGNQYFLCLVGFEDDRYHYEAVVAVTPQGRFVLNP